MRKAILLLTLICIFLFLEVTFKFSEPWKLVVLLSLLIPLVVELKDVYANARESAEELYKIKDFERLLSSLVVLIEYEGNIERALIKLPHTIDSNNKFHGLLLDLRSFILRGLTPSEYLITMSKKEKGFLKISLRELGMILSKSTNVVEDLNRLLDVVRRYKAILEDYYSLLEARRIKAKLLSIINAACMAIFAIAGSLLSSLSHNIGGLLGTLGFNETRFIINIPTVNALGSINGATMTIGYLCLSILSSFYMACSMRDPRPLSYIVLSITTYALVYLVFSSLIL
ncbi:MAG: hypothetical protein DRJ66_03365 [Thermoprotei archaeon]|nr:MAG: hypothetical protein DRJ66_03365 [Thermoprotei archaeon]RLF19824.1 MAG: hypothetical protein DRZ82_04320 [Thermoprotei archaeon]